MPGLTGRELVQKILSVQADARVLISSAKAIMNQTPRVLPSERLKEDLLRKPIKMAELFAAVQKKMSAVA